MGRTETPPQEIVVQLDIFSGRPNPRWTVSGNAADRLLNLVDRSEPAERRDPPDLGYRGFLLLTTIESVRAFEGTLAIQASRDEQPGYFRDTGGMEDLLLAQARDLGYGEVIDAFRAGSG
jgi:hypothetical protein